MNCLPPCSCAVFEHKAARTPSGCNRGHRHFYTVERDLDPDGSHVIRQTGPKHAAVQLKPSGSRESKPQTRSALLQLPAEVRFIIWRLLVGDGSILLTAGVYNIDSNTPQPRSGGTTHYWEPRRLQIVKEMCFFESKTGKSSCTSYF